MVKIAIAGGTGGLGRAIVDELETNQYHDYIILTRKKPCGSNSAVKEVNIDYTDIDNIVQALAKHQVQTIVSVLSVKTDEQCDAQLNLIRAGARTPSVKRFTPSEFATPREDTSKDPFKAVAVEELKHSGLEYTLYSHGIFMDYYGLPQIKSYMTPWVFAIDIANKAAGIPGSGNGQAAYTYSGDVAKFIIASIGMPLGSWKKHSVMIGDRRSLNEVLLIAESVRGTFDVKHDTVRSLLGGRITELPSHLVAYQYTPKENFQKRFASFGLAMEAGAFDLVVPENGVLLNELFPEIHPKTVEDVIRLGWT